MILLNPYAVSSAVQEALILSIEIKLSREPEILQQYFDLRGQCYREELGLSDFDGSEEILDLQAKILLATKGGRCIGGARISPAMFLPWQISELKLQRGTSCIWERFVFDPELRSVELIRDFCAELIDVSRASGYRHAVVLSSLRNARFYRQCHSALGVEFEIHKHLPHFGGETFAGLEHYLSVSHLQRRQALLLAA